jgi:RNA polymerase sigma-70 factor (ECF subfamily)
MNEAGQQIASPQPDPLRKAISKEEISHLRSALSTMSDDEQTLLTLRFIENMPFQDIAVILGKSEGACRVMQHRALKKLAQKLNVQELSQSPGYSL